MKLRHIPVLVAAGFGLSAAPIAMLIDAPLAHAQSTITGPRLLTAPVTDEAGVLSAGDLSRVEHAVQQVSAEKGKSLRVVFVSSFDGVAPNTWASQAVDANGPNTAVLAVSPSERAYAIEGGNQWTQREIDAMDAAAYPRLAQEDWAGAAVDAADAVISAGSGSGSGSGSGDGGGAGWLAGGAGIAALAGGGLYAASRRNTKKTTAKQLESARALDPGDTDALGRLPTHTLEQVARDALAWPPPSSARIASARLPPR